MNSFHDRLSRAFEANGSLLCVGLDPDPALMAIPDVAGFNRAIVDATKDLVCAYKPNMSFYEALGADGLRALRETIDHIRRVAPSAVVISDAKRGDIASSSAKYARALFDVWGVDAATVNPYAGGDSLAPFLEYGDRGVFVLCRTSNPGAGELQDLLVDGGNGARPVYEVVAERAAAWNERGNVGLVVGATYPEQLSRVRALCPDMPVLLPGVGAQEGELRASVSAGVDRNGRSLIISSSRSILYASTGNDFAEAARTAAERLRNDINGILGQGGVGLWTS